MGTGPAFWCSFPLLLPQALWVRHRTPRLPEAEGPGTGIRGNGDRVKFCAIGDSIVAGVGVSSTEDALPARLAAQLAEGRPARVQWTAHGFNGARTPDLVKRISEGLWVVDSDTDIVALSTGLNDLTGLASMQHWQAGLQALLAAVRGRAPRASIVHLGLPPLGSFPALPSPLRQLLGRRAEAFQGLAENVARGEAGCHCLPMSEPPEPGMFAADGYHPNEVGIQAWSEDLADRLLNLIPD